MNRLKVNRRPEEVIVRLVPAGEIGAAERRALVALVNEAFEKHRWLFPEGERTNEVEFVEETAGADLIVVEREREPVAVGFVETEDDGLYLGMVAVRPGEQGKGYGRAVLAEAEAVARRRELAKIRLKTVPELGNVTYWARYGFEVVAEERRPAGVWGAAAPWTLVTMEKPAQAT